jgi:hypothetical protein
MRKKKGVSRNLQKNPKMSEIQKLQDLSPKKKRGALLWLVDLAAAVSSDKPSEALQWWALSCLLHWYKTSSCCSIVMSLFLIFGTIHVMLTAADICYQLCKAGGRVTCGNFLSVHTMVAQFCIHLKFPSHTLLVLI